MTKTIDNKLNILVVEDTPENLTVAKEYFNSQTDLDVDYATYRDEAIEMRDKNKYDGVITDLNIPGIDKETEEDVRNIANKIFMKYKDQIGEERIQNKIDFWKKFSYTQNNSSLVAMAAEKLNIPWIICSERGDLSISAPKEKKFSYDLKLTKRLYDELVNQVINLKMEMRTIFDGVKTLEMDRVEEMIEKINNEYGEKRFDFGSVRFRNVKKQNSESWATTLKYLKQRIGESQ